MAAHLSALKIAASLTSLDQRCTSLLRLTIMLGKDRADGYTVDSVGNLEIS